MIFCRQFNVLLMAGLTIIKVLDVIYQQTESKQIKAVVLKVYEMVQKGDLLSEAMRKQGDAFPGILINMVDSGEASGKLEIVMDRMAEHFEKERKLQNKIVSSCSGKISVIYPTVEILNTCLYILVYKLYGASVETVGFCLLVSLLLLIAAIDFKTMFIPNWSILLILIAGLIVALVSQEVSWLERVIGFISAGGVLLIIAVLTGGLGGGDVKLMAAVGFYLGWKLTLWSMLLASVIGGFAGIVILASGKGKLKTEILVVGIISSVLFGDEMIRWYLGLFLR